MGFWSVFAVANTSPDSKFFSTSYKSQQENSKKYYEDAVIDFTKKLNIAIKNHSDLKFLSDSCGGCDVVSLEFDDYLKSQLPRKDYGTVIVSFFNTTVVKYLSSQHQKMLNDLIAGMLTTIVEDADYLIKTHHDMTAPGSYTDGDTSNSPYDLIDDMKKIMKLLFKDPIPYEGYINTMANDAPGLITGRFETGQWAQWTQYEIDLASDVASALGQGEDSENDTSTSGDDCEDGFCITLDIISNDSYFAGGRGTGFVNTNFEEIFGSATDWLVKKGDKRNLACKGPPPANQYQSNNDLNLSFTNIFRGLGIFLFQKTPKYAKSDGGSQEEKSSQEKEKEMDGVIADNFKSYNIDPDNLMLYTQQQMVESATPNASRAWDTANNQSRAASVLKQRQDIQRTALISAKRNEVGNPDEGTKNMFRSFGSWMTSFDGMVADSLDITKVWKDKPDCKN
jgi:hypothetical protein